MINAQQTLDIRRADILGPVATSFILALNAELEGLYPEPGANHFRLDPDEVAEGRGAFFLAYVDGQPAGCGAVRKMDADTGEIKRMYVLPEARNRGVGRAIVAALEAEGRRLEVRRLVLETGERQPDAIALYSRTGFQQIPLFGEYIGSPLSVCMEKSLKD
jgi:GNAT superfamily N-acetyltransferase